MSEAQGHNSNARVAGFIDRLDALATDRQAISDDIKDVKLEAKAAGLDPAALSAIVKQRRETEKKRLAREKLAETVEAYSDILAALRS
jgi:uncharacterized protein (UPF0335 family)